MYFELCVRVLVLSLLIFGQQAKALSYRSGGPSGITPHFDFSRSLKPASTSNDDSSAKPERFLGSYSPFHADGALSETLKPAAAPSARGYSGSHGRQVDGYSPEGSVSSYGPSQPIIRKPNQLPQANPSANGVLPTKAAPWAFPLPHNPNSFQSGIASSSAIVMHSGPYSAVPSKPQQPKNLPKPQQARYKPKPHQPKPQQAANPSNPLQFWYRPKPQQAANPSIPQQAKPYQPSYPLKLQQATNPSNPLQSRYRPKPQQTKPNQPSYTSNPQQAKPYQRSYPSNPKQAKPYQRSYPSNPQQAKPDQPSYTSNPQQAKPYQRSYPSNPQQAKPDQRSYPSNPQQAKLDQPSYTSNPQQAKPYQRSYPSNPQQAKPEQRSYPSNPQQAKPYQRSYPSNPQQAKPYQPLYPSNPQQPKPQQAKPLQGVLQSKAGMWDIPFEGSVASGSNVQPTDSNSHLNVDPRSLREIPMSFLYQPRWQQQLVPV
ncbi:adhesive plaque matrix protein-like isoform X1 [Trematomus bernacchii]|uniref:adhesive plaque matrix protein-like isoform X1 n=1 Tax=Trematomus bernacchii TaxID=40690 RepID=UPI00146CB8D8|nr:adhesive plaque matrix protein-like isoform X1 [Trematomus bernacchii]